MDYFERVGRVVDFIEANLNHKISLDDLAKQAFFSSYHFHRIFQAIVGETVMEYIRKRRLANAALELRHTRKKIIQIALEYQFNSPDAFSRAFKKYYGITPERYRKKQPQPILFEKRDFSKGAVPVYDWNFSKRIQCNDDAKNECFEMINSIISLGDKARKYGLLSLEADAAEVQFKFLRKGIDLITIGTDPILVREILETYIMAGDYEGKELLIRHIVMEGILSIQAGEHPRVIGAKLVAFLGESYMETVEKHFSFNEKEIFQKLEQFFNEIKNIPPYSTATALLEEPLAKLNDRSVQRLLRDVDMRDLACAIKGASGKIQLKIYHNIPKAAQIMFKEDMDYLGQVNVSEMLKSQNRILKIIQKLKDEGEIG